MYIIQLMSYHGPVSDQVDDDVSVPRGSPLGRDVGHQHHRLEDCNFSER